VEKQQAFLDQTLKEVTAGVVDVFSGKKPPCDNEYIPPFHKP
jgi:hypothetical protein